MKQVKINAFDDIVSFCEKGVTGLRQYGVDIQVAHITDVILQGKVDAARKGNGDYQTAINLKFAAQAALKEMRGQVVSFITLARDVLKPKLGSRYSKAWTEVGFLSPNLIVPQTKEKLLSMVKSIELYYIAHPEAEAAVLGLTHQHASDLHADYLAAMAAVDSARVTQRQHQVTRDAATAEMRAGRELLFRELRALLPATDPRWLDFGFNVPGDVVVPTAPEKFTVAPGVAGHLAPSWGKSVGADRYRIFAQVVGVDEKPAPVETTAKTSADLGGLTSGAHVKLYVIAANAAGESQPSATVEIVVP